MSAFTLNGRAHSFNGDPEMPFLWYLRDVIGMTESETTAAGRVEQTNFDSYEVTRIDAAPSEIHTHLLAPTGFRQTAGWGR